MYAVIKTGGKQYRVAANDVLKIEKVAGEVGETIAFEDVLMIGGDAPEIGTPLVSGASVAAEVVEQGRARKIIVFKKKRRKNYRRKKGHRQEQTTIRVMDILTGGKKAKLSARKSGAGAPASAKAASAAAGAAAGGAGEVQALFSRPAGEADDLTQINGIGPVLAGKLNALGVTQFAQIAAWSDGDVAKVDEVLNFKGRVEREEWIPQAKNFAGGGEIQQLFTPPDGPKDDLKRIAGVGPVLEEKLNKLGITQFAQIAAFSKGDGEKVDAVLDFKGRIEREDWIGQAKKFADEG